MQSLSSREKSFFLFKIMSNIVHLNQFWAAEALKLLELKRQPVGGSYVNSYCPSPLPNPHHYTLCITTALPQ